MGQVRGARDSGTVEPPFDVEAGVCQIREVTTWVKRGVLRRVFCVVGDVILDVV